MSDHHDDEIHISPHSMYFKVFFALVFFTVLTVWTAAMDLGHFNDVVALGIAFSKATLVVLFFMHVKYSPPLVKLVVVGSMAWLVLMFGLTFLDYASRELIVPDPSDVANPYEHFEAVHADAGHGEGSH